MSYTVQLQLDKIRKEVNAKEYRYFRVHDQYRTQQITPVTSKFYSKYDAIDFDNVSPEALSLINDSRNVAPKDKFDWPVTENGVYGWFTDPLVPYDRNDERFYFPKYYSEITKIAALAQNGVPMTTEKFVGIPWK